jgi:hypothetical protein
VKLLMNGLFLINLSVATCFAQVSTFTPTGSMSTAREFHTATLLPNGKVLIAGGIDVNSNSIASAELYDPSTGTFSPTGIMGQARGFHTATLLLNGTVLIAGGTYYYDNGASAPELSSAELYDPLGGTFSPTGSMQTTRGMHTATLLSNGKVLIANGAQEGYNDPPSAELYDPATGNFTPTGSPILGRTQAQAELLPNGNVLIIGGGNFVQGILDEAELFNPATGKFSATGSMATSRTGFVASLLPNGNVLVIGGETCCYPPLGSAEVYDATTGTFSPTVGNVNVVGCGVTATGLSGGNVLIAGGSNYPTGGELYDPATATFSATGSMSTARQNHTATLLLNGKVLIAGGGNQSGFLTSAELYGPACSPPIISMVTASPAMLWPPNNKMVSVTIKAIASDNCDPSPVTKIVSVSSNEPLNSDAVVSGEAVITGNLKLKLIAQRNGTGNGRIYTITVQCTDNGGNITTGTVNVVVPHDQGN